jgi:hypothetical protein
MKYNDFKRTLRRVGFKNKEFAQLIAVHEKTISNMAKKENIPNHMAIIVVLMDILSNYKIPFKSELSNLNLQKSEPRGNNISKKQGNVDE